MRRFLTIAIPIVTIFIFLCVMLSGNFLKKPFGDDDDFAGSLNELISKVNNEVWTEAEDKLEALEKAWDIIKPRIQFSSERDEINDINSNLARLRGAVLAEDKKSSLMEAYELFNHWDTLVE